eukprot:Seg3440.1 transcript_id=Seg3440.1/GoldUCD/mRNA.D3Y31 product="hypothetical protein" protein_id=Seg3440.1/GoldUCD/D3Y31
MENSKHSLGLLIDIVSNENDGFRKNEFNFDDFADDLDFINDNLDEEETEFYTRTDRSEYEAESLASNNTEAISENGPLPAVNQPDEREQETESVGSNNINKEDETSRSEHLSDIDKPEEKDIPILVAEKVESLLSDGISEDETMEIPSATLAAEVLEVENIEAGVSEHSMKKRVSFDLPIMEEYADDFDTEDEENESAKSDKVHSDSESSADDRNDEVSSAEVKIKKDAVTICTNCNCRMTTLRLMDLPELDSLFVNKRGKRNKKCKDSKSDSAIKKRTNVTKYQENISGSSDGKVRNSKTECKKQLLSNCQTDSNRTKGDGKEKRKAKEPVDDSWGENSNTSLLQWLKNKNKEAKQKRRQEKKIKKEEKRAKKLEELEKLCKKNLSDRLVDDWMKSKKKEGRLSRKMSGNKKVSPLECGNDDVDNGPKGYTVLNTFKKLPGRKTSRDIQREVENFHASGPKKVQKKKSLSIKKDASSSHQDSEEKKSRKSYDEWLNEKRSSRNKKAVLQNSWVKSDDDELLKNERIRRYKERQNSKIKVNSSLKTTESNVDPKSTKIKEKTKGYQWRSKELKLAQRPDPQGCDNPDSHLSSISPDSELADNDRSLSGKVSVSMFGQASDSKTEGVIEKATEGKGLLLEFLTEDNRAWMADKSSEKQIVAGKPCRPKTAHPRTFVE